MYIVRRDLQNPIISPDIEKPWEMAAFNPCPIRKDGVLHVVYRAQGRPDPLLNNVGVSTVGHATEMTGVFSGGTQLIVPSEPWDAFGCEDPRVTYFEGRYYIFYTALGGIPFGPQNIKIGCAVSDDLTHIVEKHLVTPFNSKAMALFPERVNGKIAVLLTAHTDEPPGRFGIALADSIEQLWEPSFWHAWHDDNFEKRLLHIRRHPEDQMEVGAPPVLTDLGWLVMYSYISDYYTRGRTFGIEALLLDRSDPYRVIGRTHNPILVPEEAYELYGMVPDVVFPSGATVESDTLTLYYGAADTVCARAQLSVSHLLRSMMQEKTAAVAERVAENPILVPQGNTWEARAVFNPGAIALDGHIHLLYRAMSADNTSVFGYAESTDGIHFARSPEPAYVPRADFEMKRGASDGNSGCEDPRLSIIGERVYMCYTAYNGVSAPAVAVSSISVQNFLDKKWKEWSMPILISPDGTDDKDACIFPRSIGGKYLFLHRISGRICADYLDDLSFSHRVNRCIDVMGPRKGTWESEKVGIAGVPIETEHGWVMLYHAVSRHGEYAIGAALLSKDDPTVVLARCVEPILTVHTDYERYGEVPNVVFSNGATVHDDTIFVYYGGADKVIAVATVSLARLLDILIPRI